MQMISMQHACPTRALGLPGRSVSLRGRQRKPHVHVAAMQQQSLVEHMFGRLATEQSKQAGGAGGNTTYEALQAADAAWRRMRSPPKPKQPASDFVREALQPLPGQPDFDVIMCGGTLGIFLACTLQLQGLRVAVVERGRLQGRAQEWNVSRAELEVLVSQGLLSHQELEQCIGVEFNPVRAGFLGSPEVWTTDVLNLGCRPDRLIAQVRQRFEEAGGTVLEHTAAAAVTVHANAAVLQLAGGPAAGGPAAPQNSPNGKAAAHGSVDAISGRLLIDCMGNFSPLVAQARRGQQPDGVCLVVGSCSRGFTNNTTGDVIYTNSPIQPHDASISDTQLFWEAFPSGSGPTDRTTYLFSYMGAEPQRPSLEALLQEYWERMPAYQGVRLEDITPLRILFAFFPTYKASPLAPAWPRVLQVGDASGMQSPLSFGGFGALTRHLPRLTAAVAEAVQADCLDRESLAAVNGYSPGLSAAWMFQRAMSVRPGQSVDPMFINRLLGTNFQTMQRLGDGVLRPFLQDVLQWRPLTQTLAGQVAADPLFVGQILRHVGPGPLADWLRHYIALGAFSALTRAQARPGKAASGRAAFKARRWSEQLEFGSGADYRH